MVNVDGLLTAIGLSEKDLAITGGKINVTATSASSSSVVELFPGVESTSVSLAVYT